MPFYSSVVIIKSCFRLKCNVREPECIRDILINTAKHLGSLKFGIWKKMVNLVRYGGSSKLRQRNCKCCLSSSHTTLNTVLTFSSYHSGSKHGPVQPKVRRRADLRAIQPQAPGAGQPRTLHLPRVCAGSHRLCIWKTQLDHRGGPRQRMVHRSGRRVDQKKDRRLP